MNRNNSSEYRYDIDGLRAIAVTSVVIFHLFHNALSRGFLGVDIFFVISGFLISGIILKDIQKGRFTLLNFYERRIRRLMPALLFVLAFTIIASGFILLPADLEAFGKSIIASIFFVANIYFWRDTDYFSRAAEFKPLLHLWSLGVEEQFYIFFPIILVLLYRRRTVLVPTIWFLTIGSLSANIWLLTIGGAAPAFYLLPTRAWELGAGVLITLHGQATLSPRAGMLARGGALLLLVGGLFYHGPWPWWLPVALPVVAGTAVLIWASAPIATATGQLLALRPINLVGQISYSLYLWHWPLIVLAKYYLVRDLTFSEAALVGLAAVAAAFFSWKYVEQPFRTRALSFRKVAKFSASGAAIALVAAFVVLITNGLPSRLSAEAASINRSVDTHYRCPVSQLFRFGASRACDLTLDGQDINAAEVVLLGNSHAQMYAPIIEKLLRKHKVAGALVPINGCLPTVSINISTECIDAARANLDAVNQLPELRTVIVALNWPLEGLVGSNGRPVDTSRVEALTDAVHDLASQLGHRRVIVVGPIAEPDLDIASVLSRQIAFGVEPRAATSVAAEPFRAKFATVFERIGNRDGIRLVRPDLYQCTRTRCYFVKDGVGLFSDSNHLAQPALKFFAPAFEGILDHEVAAPAPPPDGHGGT